MTLWQKLKRKQNSFFMPAEFRFEAIGTSWKIDILNEVSSTEASFLKKTILDRIELFDTNYSRFRADSLVTRMSKNAGTYTLPSDAKPLFDIYKKLYDLTGGMVTPLIGSLMNETGYDADYSLMPKELHRPPSWEEVMVYDFPSLTLTKPAFLDFGAIGKGYLIDIVGEILTCHHIKSFTVDAGSDILYKNNTKKSLRVGLENPQDFTQVVGVAEIYDQSICGSSGSRRKWAGFHHIMHPFALRSVEDVVATWAIAPTALLADAFASALFFMPGEFLRTHFDFEYVTLYHDFSTDKSPNFPGEIFKK